MVAVGQGVIAGAPSPEIDPEVAVAGPGHPGVDPATCVVRLVAKEAPGVAPAPPVVPPARDPDTGGRAKEEVARHVVDAIVGKVVVGLGLEDTA